MKAIVLLLTFLFCCFTVFCAQAQNEEVQNRALAQQYMNEGDYDKAIQYFEDLFKDKPSNLYYYQSLMRCYERNDQLEDAAKMAKKMSKKSSDPARYLVDLGKIYKLQGDSEAAEKEWDNAIDQLQAERSKISLVANAFKAANNTDRAIQTYEKGQQIMKNGAPFSYELGLAYQDKGDWDKAADAFIRYAESSSANVQRAKNALSRSRDNESSLKAMERRLYDYAQKDSRNPLYPELLIWIYQNRKDYESALIQAKALDRRMKENGMRILQLAKVAQSDESYDAAIECYQYLVDKGENSAYYHASRKELLKCRKLKLNQGSVNDRENIELLAQDYSDYLETYGRNRASALTMIELAQLQGLYLHDLENATATLKAVSSMVGLTPTTLAKAKLTLGDFYVMSGDVWEATLIYAQVDKDFKEGAIGEDARFRNARLSYYKGEFEWAQAQLKILKGSTTELVANDALDLSIFIIDNLGLDSIFTPMNMFSRAELLMYQNRFNDARATLDSLTTTFPGHKLSDDIAMAMARMYIKEGDYTRAESRLKDITTIYKDDLLCDDALFLLGELYEEQLDRKDDALACYKEILFEHKDSVLIVEARKRFRRLRGDEL